MDQKNALGCMGIVGLVLMIIMAIVGGVQRTEVTYTPPDVSVAGNQTDFKEILNASHWVLGLIKGRQPDLDKAIAKYLRPGEQITKLTIITRHTWINYLVAGVTAGIYCPQSVIIKGSVARK